MEHTDIKYQAYVQILKEELVPAMGCTEPIALAYGAKNSKRSTWMHAGQSGNRGEWKYY